ncbi:MAG: hypothetical protein BWY95_02125 [Bacteroidetes bacterium ADurb.BinA104]|nr:MAG: hypothetical protein BWY95_02125 [Bacteroidetes bacterium ADurb.BinA104]
MISQFQKIPIKVCGIFTLVKLQFGLSGNVPRPVCIIIDKLTFSGNIDLIEQNALINLYYKRQRVIR